MMRRLRRDSPGLIPRSEGCAKARPLPRHAVGVVGSPVGSFLRRHGGRDGKA